MVEKKRGAEIGLSKLDSFIFKNTNNLLLVIDRKGIIVKCSPSIKKLGGYDLNEIIGNNAAKFIHKSDLKRAMAYIIKFKQVKNELFRLIKKDKSIMYARIKSSVFKSDNKELFFCFINDITDTYKREKELKQSGELFRKLFDDAPDAYYLMKNDTTIVDANKSAEKIIGYKKDKFIGQKIHKCVFVPLNEVPKILSLTLKRRKNGSSGPQELTIINKKKKKTPVEIKSKSLNINNEKLVLGVAKDLTKERLLKYKVDENALMFKNIFNSVNDPVIISKIMPDGSLNIIDANQKAIDISGYVKKTLIKKDPDNLFSQDKEGLKNLVKKLKLDKEVCIETEIITKKKIEIPVEMKSIIFNINNDEFITTILHDISDRKKREEDLRNKIQQLETFKDVAVERELKMKELEKKIAWFGKMMNTGGKKQ